MAVAWFDKPFALSKGEWLIEPHPRVNAEKTVHAFGKLRTGFDWLSTNGFSAF